MIFLLSGEGPTDMGACRLPAHSCSGADFEAGPLAVMVRQIVDRELGKISAGWALPDEAIELVPHAALKHVDLPKAQPTSSQYQGKKAKRQPDTIYFTQEARVLGYLAQQKAAQDSSPVAAVLFRDLDSRRSSKSGLWEDKVESMVRGFALSGCHLGVPMVANPTSEAWLFCGLKQTLYQNGDALETFVSASDESPHWGKKLVADALGIKVDDVTGSMLADLVRKGPIKTHKIDMKSFNEAKQRLVAVIGRMIRTNPPSP